MHKICKYVGRLIKIICNTIGIKTNLNNILLLYKINEFELNCTRLQYYFLLCIVYIGTQYVYTNKYFFILNKM